MSRVNAFNPAAFQQQPKEQSEGAGQAASRKAKKDLPYQVTDNSSRDQVRKMLWEAFGGAAAGQAQSGQDEQGIKYEAHELVAMLEDEVFKVSKEDAKTKEYRDRCNKLQMKLKGPRFAQTRQDLKTATVTVEHVCSDEFLNQKAQVTTGPPGMARGAPGMPRGRGMGGPAPRGRGMPPSMMGRGRAAPMGRPPNMPAFKPAAPTEQEKVENSEPQSVEEKNELKQEEEKPIQKEEEKKIIEKPQELSKQEEEPTKLDDQPVLEEQKPPVEEQQQEQQAKPQNQFMPPKPMGRGGPRPPMRGMPPTRGRGVGPNLRGGPLPGQRQTSAFPQQRSSPPKVKESDQSQQLKDDQQMPESQDAQNQPINTEEKQEPSSLNETQKVEESIEASRVELEFPDTSNIVGDDSDIQQKTDQQSIKSGSDKIEGMSAQESSNKDKSNPKSDSQNYEDSSSQVASQSDNKIPTFDASLDDSQILDPNNTSISFPKKVKKVKKIKKVKKKAQRPDQSLRMSMREENELNTKLNQSQNFKSADEDQLINLPLQPKPAVQKSKPVELTADQVQNAIKEKQEGKGQIALLTKEKLQQFDSQFPNKFNRDIDDTDLESVILDQTIISPRPPIQPAQEIVQQVANQLEMKPIEIERTSHNQQASKQNGNEQAANKEGHTIKSKSLSYSQAGVHDSDAVRRLQDTLQSKKELINELNQKHQSSQSDYQILSKKFKLVQDENQKLKDELSQQKASFRQNEERVFNLNQQLVIKEQANHRIQKEKDDLVSQLMQEINTLKSERDLYMDRYQKTMKESVAERQKIERKMHMNSFNNSNDIMNVLKQVQMFASSSEFSAHQIDTASSGGQQLNLVNRSSSRNHDDHGKNDEHGPELGSSLNGGVGHHHERQPHLNSASNYQEINLQNQLNEIKEQYEQRLKDQQKQLDGVTLDLHKVQRLNDSYRENNRKLTDAVQQNIERGNISVMAGSGAPNTTTDMLYQQMMDNISQEDIDDDDSLPPSSQQPKTSPSQETNRQGTVNEVLAMPQSDQSTTKHLRPTSPHLFGAKQAAASQAQANTNHYQGSQQQQQQQPDHGAEHGSQRQGGTGINGANRGGNIRGSKFEMMQDGMNNQRQQNYRNIHGSSYFENQQDEATGGESHHGFQNSSQNIFDDNMQQNIADQQSALAQDNNTINDQSVLDHFQNNHQSSALQTSSHIQTNDVGQTSQSTMPMGIPNIEGPSQQQTSQTSQVHILDTSHHSGSVAAHHQISAPQQQNSAAAAAAMKGHHGKYGNLMMDSDQHQQQRNAAGGSAQQMQQDHSGDRDDRAMMDEGVVVDGSRRLRDKVKKGKRIGDDSSLDADDDDHNKSESEITEEDDMDDESRDESRDDDFRDSQAYSGMDEDELDDDDSEDSQGSNDDANNDLGQIGLDNQNDMSSNALQGTLGGASGTQNDRRSADVGGLSSQNQHIGPGAIPSQNFPQGANNQNRNLRQTGSGVRYGTHGNMPHQFQQNAQQQYGSSGASGHSNRGVNQMQMQHTQNQQNDDSKNPSSQYMQSHQTASASGATGSGVSNTNQRRNRRGNRQQNQQPSSGANGGENVAVRRSNRQNNNRQGRQTIENVASGGGGSSQMTISNREPNDVGAAHGHRHSGGNQNNQRINERSAATANSQDQQHYQTNNQQDQRGRSQRTYNRGRQQRNNQQQQQIGQNAAAPTQQSNSSGQQIQSSMQQQPAPVSLSQEREQKAQNQGYNRFMSAGLGSGSGSAQEMQMSSQSAAQAHLRRMNMGSGGGQTTNENQAVQQVIQMNAPASTQSHYSRGNHQQQNYQQRQQLHVQSSAIQGAASQTHMNSQSSQMIPASTASHSGDTQSHSFSRGYEGQNNQQTTGAPHGGGGSQRQMSGSRMQDNSGSNQAASMGQQEGRNNQNSHHNGVVHTVSFESGSTSFMDRQANSGLAAGEQSQPSYGGSQHANRQSQQYQRPKNTFTSISQVSSPPSNNMNMMGSQMMQQVRNQSNQQNDILAHQFTQNTPNSDMSGPGAVGAPPSTSQQQISVGAINPVAQSSQLVRPGQSQPQYQSTNMPSSSGINETTQSSMMMAAHQPHQQQQQNVSPGSSQTASGGQGSNALQNSGPGQGGGGAHHQGQHINPRMQQNQPRGVPLPSVPENNMMHHHGSGRDMPQQQHIEEEKQSSHQLGSSGHHQQQSIMTIPSSLFGGANQSNTPSMSLSGIQEHQTPAALQMVGIGNDALDSSAGTGTALQLNFNTNTSNLFGSGFDDSQQQNSLMNYINSGQEQRATPPRRNNDSRKTSGANTPSKDGANTPTTHQSQSQQMMMGMWLNQN